MYLKVASSLPVMIPNPPPGGPVVASTAAAGMSGLGRRRAVRIRVPIVVRPVRRGVGAVTMVQDPCDCYYPIAGVPDSVANPNNKPQCDPATGIAPACAGQDEPPCSGIPYGAPGYTQCLQSASVLAASDAANVGGQASADAVTASFNALIKSVPAPAAAAATPPATPPAAKRAKVAAPAPASSSSVPPAASPTTTAPAASSLPAATTPAAGTTAAGPLSFLTGSISLFGFQIPVLLVGGVAIVGVMMLSGGGKKR